MNWEQSINELTEKDYEEVLKNSSPAVVVFYSEECPPCEFFKPIFLRAAGRYKEHIHFFRVQKQQNRTLAEQLKINSSPTVLFLKSGNEVCQRLTGYIQNTEFQNAVNQVLEGRCPQNERKKMDVDVLVLGGGPAGLTAALYLARARLKTVVVDENPAGGQVLSTFHIANYPGTKGVVRGSDLVGNMKEQAMNFGALIDDLKQVRGMDLQKDMKHIDTEDTDYYAGAAVLCTGAEPRRLPAEGEREFRGRGVHYCATCDGALYQDKKIIVVGGGNSALQEAIFLTRFASSVTIIHQYDHFQATQVSLDEVKNNKIEVVWNAQVQKIIGENNVKSLLLKDLKTGESREIQADGVFVYIGTQPRSEAFRDQIKLNENGYVIVDEGLRTNLAGIYAAGDVRDKKVRQIATAVGDGALAAMAVETFLAEARQPQK